VTQQSQTVFGMMQTQNICPTCAGSGKLYTKDGKKIPGGLETSREEVTVNVPAGIKDGVYIRYS
jgi:molecular chaperone DnaJ